MDCSLMDKNWPVACYFNCIARSTFQVVKELFMSLHNKKSALVSMALLALLASGLTGCGKSKEARNPAPQQTPPATIATSPTIQSAPQTVDQNPVQNPGQAQAQAPSQTQSQTQAQTQNSVQTQSQQPQQAKPEQSIQQPSRQQVQSQVDETNPISNDPLVSSKGQSDLNNNGNEILSPLPSAPAGDESQSDESSVIKPPLKLAEKSKGSAKTVDFTQSSIKTGGRMGDLYYTSAGNDGLMEEFKSYNSKVSKDQQTMNMNLSKNIIVAKLSKQRSTGLITVSLTVDEFGKSKVYKLKGSVSSDRVQLAEDVSSGRGDIEFQGGFLKCLDRDGGCENAYAKLKFSGAYTRIIFRNSYSDMHFQIQSNVSNNN